MDRRRFIRLWQRNVAPPAAQGVDVFERLARSYAEPHRRYHNAAHIEQCLRWLDRYTDQITDPDAVELAIWFHDACYTPDPRGHEARGAKLFGQLSLGGMAHDRQRKICTMILFTTHCGKPQSDEEALLVDIDLASFARPWHQYVIDTAACRAERKQVDDAVFCLGQIDFLQSMLARPWFYTSAPFRQHHEAQARRNMARMVALLQRREQRLRGVRPPPGKTVPPDADAP